MCDLTILVAEAAFLQKNWGMCENYAIPLRELNTEIGDDEIRGIPVLSSQIEREQSFLCTPHFLLSKH